MHLRQVNADAAPGPRRRLDGRAGQPGGPQVLYRQHRARVQRLQAGFDEHLFEEGIAHLNRGPQFRFLLEGARCQPRCAVNAIASRVGSRQQQHAARYSRRRRCQPVRLYQPDAHGVDQRVVGIGRVEVDFAAYVWNSDTVAVPRDAAHHAAEQVAVNRALR